MGLKWSHHADGRRARTQNRGQRFDPGWVKTDLGGPHAPGSPEDSAEGALALVTAPFAETGKFWKDGREIPY